MEEHIEASDSNASPPVRKRTFTRQRKRILGIAETIVDGQVKFKITGLYVAGRRVRKFYPTRKEAQTFIDAQTVREGNIGTLAKHMDSQLANDAAEAQIMIKPFKARLLDVARQWTEARELLQDYPDVSLAECVKHYAQILKERRESWTAKEGAAAWKASLEAKGRSDSYVRGVSWRLERFTTSYGKKLLSEFTPEEIEKWIRKQTGKAGQSQKNYMTILASMFAFAVKKGKAPRNPLLEVEKPDVIRDEVGILTPADLKSLLTHLPDDAKAFVVLSAFAGLRPSETQRLDWTDINFETSTIVVGARKSKTKRRRVVPMTANLSAWLKPLAKEEGRVVTLADLTIRQKRLKPAREKAKITRWPHDCLRHSAATYWLQTEQDSARVALWLGHDQSVLHEHYKGLLTNPKDAEEWFNIMPPQDEGKAKIVPFKVA